MLKREKRKDDLHKFAARKFTEDARAQIEGEIEADRIAQEEYDRLSEEARVAVRLEREQEELLRAALEESGDNED